MGHMRRRSVNAREGRHMWCYEGGGRCSRVWQRKKGDGNVRRRRERTHPLLVARSPAAAAFPLLLLVGNTRLVCVTVMTPPSESVEGKTVLEGVGVALV